MARRSYPSRGFRYEVAAVGLGPHGVLALERLLAYACELPAEAALTVSVLDPRPAPAAGSGYDPALPSCLRAPVPTAEIDIWPEYGGGPVPEERRASLSVWRRAQGGEEGATSGFPRRSDVGAYLCAALGELLANLPPRVSVRFERVSVRRLHAVGRRWKIESAEGGPPQRFDQVLLLDPGALAVGAAGGVAQAAERTEAGSVLAARGFGRAFADLALALTEGRGGAFVEDGGSLRYAPSGAEPARILPYSRSGSPPAAQPEAGALPLGSGPAASLEAAAERLASKEGALSLQRDILPALADAAGSLLRESSADTEAAVAAAALLAGTSAPPGRPRAALARAIAVARGETAPDERWAMGEVWRRLHPVLARRCSVGALRDRDRIAFARLAASLDRIAFAQPVGVIEKLSALVDAGIVDLRHAAGGILGELPGGGLALRSAHAPETRVDAALDAVAPPLGARHLSGGPVAELVSAGYGRLPAGCRGLEIAGDGRCVGAAGKPTVGLAALGPLTEDWVIGSCSLDPNLHSHADRWARGVAGRTRAVARLRRRIALGPGPGPAGIDRTKTGNGIGITPERS